MARSRAGSKRPRKADSIREEVAGLALGDLNVSKDKLQDELMGLGLQYLKAGKPDAKTSIGATFMWVLLWMIGVAFAAILAAWWLTRPTLTEARELLGSPAEAKEVLALWRDLTRDHLDQILKLVQTIALSGLIPLFTLLAGYVFGSRQAEQRTEKKDDTP